MALVNSKKMFEMAYKNGYAIGAFNVNNMEIVQPPRLLSVTLLQLQAIF